MRRGLRNLTAASLAASLIVAGAVLVWWQWPDPARAPEQADAAPLEIGWADLIPEALGDQPVVIGQVSHMQAMQRFGRSAPAPSLLVDSLVRDYDQQVVRMPGYVVPLAFQDANVTEFLLVPYVGACIHVPPPPPNQLVFVKLDTPVHIRQLFEPVWVTGILNSTPHRTELAEAGYEIAAIEVERYVFKD